MAIIFVDIEISLCCVSFRSVVVITLASHARGPEFDPRCSYCTCYTCTAYVGVLDGMLQTCCAWSHTSEFLCCHIVSTMKLIIHNTNALLGSTSPRYVVCLSCVPRFTGFLDKPTKISQHFVTMTQQLQHYIRRVTSIPNIYTKQCGCVLHCLTVSSYNNIQLCTIAVTL